jgi:hypothetical protein
MSKPSNVRKLVTIHPRYLGFVRQSLGAVNSSDCTFDDKVNQLANNEILEHISSWELGNKVWWSEYFCLFNQLEYYDSTYTHGTKSVVEVDGDNYSIEDDDGTKERLTLQETTDFHKVYVNELGKLILTNKNNVVILFIGATDNKPFINFAGKDHE